MKALHLLAAAAIALVVASCSSKPKVSYMPAKADDGDNWGLVDANGEFLFSDEFASRPSAVVNGYFFVEESDGYTVYRAEKTPKPVGDLTNLASCGYYNEGVMPVAHKGEPVSFVDSDGNVKFTLDEVDGVRVRGVFGMFINGRCAFRTVDDDWGAIDTDGNVVIKPRYHGAPVFIDDLATVVCAGDDIACLIDRNGNVKSALPSDIDDISPMVDGYAFATSGEEEGRMLMIDKKGKVTKLPAVVRYVTAWNSKYIVFENSDGEEGIMTIGGEVKVRAKYDHIELLANGGFIGKRGGKYMLIDPESGETQKVSDETGSAVRYAYLFSNIFDYDFELVSEGKSGKMLLRSYDGDKKGRPMERFKNRIDIEIVNSDYYDYDAVTDDFLAMFDGDGLKGYPFGSRMGSYANPSHSTEWYRGDRSMSISPDCSNTYFGVSSASVRSDEYIVYDSTPYASYYTWSFNPQSTVDEFSLTISFNGNNYRDDLTEHFAKALREKFNIQVSEGSKGLYDGFCCVYNDGYEAITIKSRAGAWLGEPVAVAAEEDISVAADSAVVACDSVCAK